MVGTWVAALHSCVAAVRPAPEACSPGRRMCVRLHESLNADPQGGAAVADAMMAAFVALIAATAVWCAEAAAADVAVARATVVAFAMATAVFVAWAAVSVAWNMA